ncbi:hypothetical protein H0H92_002055 [Tricholoma furcatifolium]|nr:hypothetical protein H0H92_002055 [Tricholoma furcatifolium]
MSPPRMSSEDKRQNNVFFTPGTKTPRKVQWLDKDPSSSTHSLDEHGLDPTAFQRLTQALERHRASSRVHHYPPQPEPAHTVGISDSVATFRLSGNTGPQRRASIGAFTEESSSSESKSPHHYVPGNYIDATERAGLPGMQDSSDAAQEQAEKVVNSHTRKRRFGHRPKFVKKWNKTRKMFSGGNSEDTENTDVERNAGTDDTPQVGGGGVLSTLLTLYGEGMDMSSGVSTPAGSVEDLRERPWAHLPQRPPSSLGNEVIPDSPSLSRTSSRGEEEKKASKFQQLNPSHLLSRHKNPKARNAGGVFGPLIASTGNLTGFVAPSQSQLQPDIKRPGYHLSRYSFDDKPKPSVMPPKLGSRPKSVIDDTSSYAPSLRSAASSPPSPTNTDPGPARTRWTGMLKDLPAPSIHSFGGFSGASTPARSTSPMLEVDDYFSPTRPVEMESWKEKKRKRKRAAVYITRHVATILERQAFILKFSRAMMMFGGPSHRLQSQINSTARVLDLEVSCVYFPDVLVVSFDDSTTSTSNVKFIRQGSSLDLIKLADAYKLYWKVIHDKLSVSDASSELDLIMRRPQLYNRWQLMFFGGMCSSSICTGFIVLNGALEIMSRNIVAGSVRLCYSIMYALFLGFGLAIGGKAFVQITGSEIVGTTDITCSISHPEGAPWYRSTPSKFWVGVVANLYARLFRGNAFVVMITGILFQLPSGLGSGGLLNYVSLQTQGDANSYVSGFQTAMQLISVGIGLTVGLGISLVIMHPVQSKRVAGGIFSL